MKADKIMEFSFRNRKITLVVAFFIVVTVIPLYYYPFPRPPLFVSRVLSKSPLSHDNEPSIKFVPEIKDCDIFSGQWVPNPMPPYYTNTTCWEIDDHQNCMKFERPDTEFMKWKWKPDGCDLPIFNPYQFLEILKGRSIAFVGDSVSRNQMQSLICLLSRVEHPIDVSYTTDEYFKPSKYTTYNKRWQYATYNLTIAFFWTSYLIRSEEADPNDHTSTRLFNLYLDEFDKNWTSKIEEFDYVVISSGHWFERPMVFYEKSRIVGCHNCLKNNVTDLTEFYGYRKAFRTAFKALNSLEKFKGITYLRTYSPSHFENGLWNQGGSCQRTKPYKRNEKILQGTNLELYMIQLEEFNIAVREAKNKESKFRLLDITRAFLLRPDGHPNRYGHRPQETVKLHNANDCVHWCMPGPVDTWNEFMLEMLKMEIGKGKTSPTYRKMRIK